MSNPVATPGTLVIERVFPHPREKLWRALTESPLIAQWLMSNDFEPTVGHRFSFRREPVPGWNGVIDSEVLVIEPLKRLSYRWDSMGVETVVQWTLTPADGGTHLRFEQSGFGPEQKANYQGAKYGWTGFIGNLEKIVAELQ
jgi:uncharacterized protein YndB with AHSA1/START domain